MDLTKELITIARQFESETGTALFHLNSLMGATRYVSDARIIQKIMGQGRNILDLGCGWGQMAYLLKRLGLQVTATDIQEKTPFFVEYYNRSYGGDEIYYHYADILEVVTDNSLAGRTYDAICLSGVLEHVPDFSLFLNRIRGMLSKHGKIFIFRFPNRHSWIESLNRLRFGNAMDHPLRFTKSELNLMLRWHGFSIDASSYEEIFPVNLRGFPPTLVKLYHSLNPLLLPLSRVACVVPLLNRASTSFRIIGTRAFGPDEKT